MTEKSIITMMREAKAKGLKTFSTGKPCAKGHIADRYVNSRSYCIECERQGGLAKTAKRRAVIADAIGDDNLSRVISRKDAKAQGLQRYFTGLPCKRFHISERYVSGFACVDCAMPNYWRNSKSPRKQFLTKLDDGTYTGHPCRVCGDTRRNKTKQCPTCVIRLEKEGWERRTASRYARKARDPIAWSNRLRETNRRCREKNPSATNIHRDKRRKCKPAWIDDAHERKIRSIYRKRKKGEHVDHIVPLLGKNVCGLHVWWNLQILSAFDNVSKGSKFPYCEESKRPAFVNLAG